jgi:hypothetical protein
MRQLIRGANPAIWDFAFPMKLPENILGDRDVSQTTPRSCVKPYVQVRQ